MEIEAILDRFAHFGVDLGLQRIERLLADLGHLHHQVPVLHVAGSNGKGSVCAYLSAVLTEAGFRVGRYISPHLVSWCERICLNDIPIAPSAFKDLLLTVEAAIRPDEPSPTQFEVITAAAWLYFAQQKVDVAVMEVGLGGRLDATNVCDCSLVSIITSISREHWQRLGPTLADIAGEKAGILKPGCPAAIGLLPEEARRVVHQRIASLQCQAVWVQPAKELGNGWAEYSSAEAFGDAISTSSLQYPLPLLGAHQLMNSALAIAAIQILQQQGWTISREAIVRGMANTRWPGRLQWVTWNDQTLLVDGAHNPAAAEVLRTFVDRTVACSARVHWVMGMLSTKDHADVFKALLRPGDRLYLVPVPDHSSADPEELAQLALAVCPDLDPPQTFGDLREALERALLEKEEPELTVLCGSLYLLGHFFKPTP